MKYIGIYWTLFAPMMKKSIAKRFDKELADRAEADAPVADSLTGSLDDAFREASGEQQNEASDESLDDTGSEQ